MITKEENELLCRVENGAPMGKLMRQHWVPICLSEEVAETDGDPVTAKILGENLVVFRDSDGQVGVLDEACPHRGPSLSYGRNEEGGLRCLYHGWKFDVHGNVMEMVSEPASSGFMEKVKHKAYPVKEWGGMIWAWMGDQDNMPEFVPPRWAPTADTRVSIAKAILPVNWAQVLEGAIDSAHSSSLHSSDMVPARVHGAEATDKNWLRPSTDKAPRLQIQKDGYGFRYAAIRRPIFDAQSHDYVRTTVFVAPWTVLIPPNNLYNVANVNVPIDDENMVFYFIGWGHPSQTPETATWRKFLHLSVGTDLDERYRLLRNHENRFGQDRQAMKAGNFTGIKGIPNQDMAMWLTMGRLVDRTRDRLGASDLAVVEFRKQMIAAVNDVANGNAAIGTGENSVPNTINSFQRVIPKEQDWRSYPAQPVWAGDEVQVGTDDNYTVKG